MPKITKRLVDALRSADGPDEIYWDSELKGFGLRVLQSGRRSFIVQFRTRDGRSRRRVLGAFPVITADQARDMARDWLSEARRGGDPAAARDKARHAATVEIICGDFLNNHAAAHKKARSTREDRRIIDRYILPAFGSWKATAVSRDDVQRLHSKMRASPYQANRVLALLSTIFNFASDDLRNVRSDWTNPCKRIRRFAEEKRRRYLSARELGKLGEALVAAEHEGIVSKAAIAAVRLLVFTGCRRSEILGLRWPEVDLERSCLHLEDSKTGRKDVYLSPPAIEVLQRTERTLDSEYVFPGPTPETHREGIRKGWDRIRKRAGITDVRLHDLRHTFASVGAGAGLSLPLIGALLGHTDPVTTQRYAHLSSDPLRQATDLVGKRIEEAMQSSQSQTGRLTLSSRRSG